MRVGQMLKAADGVNHMGAIPGPTSRPDQGGAAQDIRQQRPELLQRPDGSGGAKPPARGHERRQPAIHQRGLAGGPGRVSLAGADARKPRTPVTWAYADPDDVAETHVLAQQADLTGHEAFMLAQPTIRFKESTVKLIELNFGSKVAIQGELKGNPSVISAEKARRMLGWTQRPGWSEG